MYYHVDTENGRCIFSFHRTRTLYDLYFLTDTLRNNVWLNYRKNFLKSQHLFPVLFSPNPFPASKRTPQNPCQTQTKKKAKKSSLPLSPERDVCIHRTLKRVLCFGEREKNKNMIHKSRTSEFCHRQHLKWLQECYEDPSTKYTSVLVTLCGFNLNRKHLVLGHLPKYQICLTILLNNAERRKRNCYWYEGVFVLVLNDMVRGKNTTAIYSISTILFMKPIIVLLRIIYTTREVKSRYYAEQLT